MGQEEPKVEVFGGYSYANIQLLSDRSGFNGWNASATVNLNRWFGLTIDFSGAYGSSARETIPLPPIISGTETIQLKEKVHTFLFGPQFSWRHKKLTPFGHMLLVEERFNQTETVSASSSSFFLGTPTPFSLARMDSAVLFGGGVDYAISQKLARRLQADYSPKGFSSRAENNVRISTGLVFRFGAER